MSNLRDDYCRCLWVRRRRYCSCHLRLFHHSDAKRAGTGPHLLQTGTPAPAVIMDIQDHRLEGERPAASQGYPAGYAHRSSPFQAVITQTFDVF